MQRVQQPRGLNPFFVRAGGQTGELERKISLNPFFVRAGGQTCRANEQALLEAVLVLIPSSSGLVVKRVFTMKTKLYGIEVLIPSSSGLVVKPEAAVLNGQVAEVLIPSSSGLVVKPESRRLARIVVGVLIPSSSGLVVKRGLRRLPQAPKSSLNPFFVRAGGQTTERGVKRIRKR